MSRQTVREELVTLFTAEGSFNQVLGYLPVVNRGMDKVLAIYAASASHEQESADLEMNLYGFDLLVIVERSNGEAAEDTFDALHEAIRSTVRANQGNANWEYLSLRTPSEAYFANISGASFRVETHRLTVKEI